MLELPLYLKLIKNLEKTDDYSRTQLHALANSVKEAVEKNCVYYKWLRGGVTIVNSIPKSPSGKTARAALKDLQGFHVDYYKGTLTRNKL
ncbi:hypothetical protein M422DRAFT_248350 [Sphaerobolus stellatus SS14]|uniref:Uncharacterized protein n=1 Tax=Sphaerobolus stellatus (strain SS14) TaxID=990650 RepID=A0A0C9W5S1_SPHS4|nr:hypothetical protein M422DRAFT_248350 [Sphaerobolus stellatus SS14]